MKMLKRMLIVLNWWMSDLDPKYNATRQGVAYLIVVIEKEIERG